MPCSECKKRGKTWEGADPICAFESGIFSPGNWACATLLEIRNLASRFKLVSYASDNYAVLVPILTEDIDCCEDCFEWALLVWYKSRGQTMVGQVVTDISENPVRPLTIKDAEGALKYLRKLEKCNE